MEDINDEKKGRVFHVIDSVKGGCGKTTFSIMLTYFLEQQRQAAAINGEICLLDLDLLGTGMSELFYGKDAASNNAKTIFLNEKLRGFNISDKKYIHEIEVGNNSKLYVGLSDSSNRGKNQYRVRSKYNYQPTTGFGAFRAGIKKIFEKGELERQIAGEEGVKNIILDMAPGNDVYSDAVKDCLMDRAHSDVLKNDDKCYYYLMVGMDASHQSAAESYLLELFEGEDVLPDKIFIVINDFLMYAAEEKEKKSVYQAKINKFKQKLEKFPEEIREKICFFVLHPFEKYANVVQMMKPLYGSNKGHELFLDVPVRYYGTYKKDIVTVIAGNIEDWKKWVIN